MKTNLLLLLLIASVAAFPVLAKNDNGNKGKSIPKGLQKKVAKGKPLPPGWEKKLSRGNILGKDIYSAGKIIMPVNKKGIVTIKVENKTIRLMKATREIVEILE
ncbi:MAG: hypothetical protein KAR30_02380 [Gammaproteobacteria bacterium]|nr:hypothetical protein [Gammaproteobacteria bacterium]